jgi:hypothetical protein
VQFPLPGSAADNVLVDTSDGTAARRFIIILLTVELVWRRLAMLPAAANVAPNASTPNIAISHTWLRVNVQRRSAILCVA